MSLSDGDNFGLQAWNSRSDFLDGGIDEWLPSSWSELLSSPEPSMENSTTAMTLPPSATSPSVSKPREEPAPPPPRMYHQEDMKKQPKKRKGRPKLESKNEVSAKERRRAQVRLAQQAYRQRKDGHAKLLEKENEDLQSRLSKVQISFGKLLAITTEAGIPLEQLNIVQSLTQEVQESILPRVPVKEDNQTVKDSESKTRFISCSSTNLDPTSELASSTENDSYAFPTSGFQGFERHSFKMPFESTQLLKELSVSPFDQVPSSPLPFALRLRVEALKRGYELLSSSETSFVALRRAFHRHIFSESRDRIIRRICLHLGQTMKAIHGPTDGNWETSKAQTSFDPSQRLLYSTAVEDSTIKRNMNESSVEGYIYPEDIPRHLLQKGLDISTGSAFVSLSPGLVSDYSQAPSLFDEIVAGRQLHLSLRKLLHELLNRVTCLEMGPGFQYAEIDEALRLTIIKAI